MRQIRRIVTTDDENGKSGVLIDGIASNTITVLTEQTLSCQSASKKFAKFLRRPDGDLPNRWRLNARKAVSVRTNSFLQWLFGVGGRRLKLLRIPPPGR